MQTFGARTQRRNLLAAAAAVDALFRDWGLIEKTVAPARGRRRPRKPTVAEVIHRDHGGPDPATLPRRRRRMRFPEQFRFHVHRRDDRPPVPTEKVQGGRRGGR